MDSLTTYTKTGRGLRAQIKKLPPNAGQILFAMSATSTASELHSKLRKMNVKDFDLAMTWLLEGGYIRVVSTEPFSNSVWAPVTQSAIQVDEISFDEFNQTIKATIAEAIEALAKSSAEPEADEKSVPEEKPATPPTPISTAKNAKTAAPKVEPEDDTKAKAAALAKADEEARERAEAQLKAEIKAKEDAEAKAATQAKAETEALIAAKAEQEAREKAAATAKEEAAAKAAEEAKAKAEALAKAEAEARERAEAEARKVAEAQEKARAQEEAKAQAKAEVEAKVKAEAAAKAAEEARAKAEALAKADEEARLRAEAEAKKIAEAQEKAAAEARAKAEAKAAEEARLLAERQTKEAEEARLRAEEEAQAKAEAEARAKAEAQAREEAEAKERAKAVARAEMMAKAEAAEKIRLEAEAKAKVEAEEKARAEAEAQAAEEARLVAEQQAKEAEEARLRAEAKAIERAKAEEKARAEAEAKAREIAQAKAEAKAKKQAARKAAMDHFKQNIALKIQQFKTKKVAKTPVAEVKSTAAEEEIAQAPSKSFNLKSFKKTSQQWQANILGLVKTLLFTLVILLLVTALAAQFINISILLKPIQNIASENLQERVKIESVHASLFPSPHLTLNDVAFGNDKNTVTAKKIHVYPVTSALINRIKNPEAYANKPYEIESMTVDGLSIAQPALSRPADWLSALSHYKQLKINQISLNKALVRLNNVELAPLNGNAQLTADSQFKSAWLSTEDKNATLTIEQATNQVKLTLKAERWRLPIGLGAMFTELNAAGFLENNTLTLSQIEGDLYNGKLKGNMVVDLAGTWQAKGDIELSDVKLANAAEDLQLNGMLEGNLNTNTNFSFNYNTANNSIESSVVNSRFKINNGAINRIDLIEAIRTGNLGGATQFAELTGNLTQSNQSYEFKNLTLQDKQLQAYGKVDIGADKAMNADIYAKIPLKTNPIKAHLILDGTSDSPKLKK